LQASGFNGGESLKGRENRTEDSDFTAIIAGVIESRSPRLVRKVTRYQGHEILKSPYASMAIKYLYNRNKLFKKAKYIWMQRDLDEVAKSLVRKQRKYGYLKFEKFTTVRGALRQVNDLDERWRKFFLSHPVDHIQVWLDELIEDTDSVGRRVSNFIGRKFDTELVTKDETWKVSHKVLV
jgi:hypothetical protein